MNGPVPRLEGNLFNAAFGFYLAAIVVYVVFAATRRQGVGRFATGIAWLGFLLHSATLVARGVAARRVPYVSMYEYLMAFAWAAALLYLVMRARARARRVDWDTAGALVFTLVAGLLGYGSKLPTEMKQVEALMPVLRSNWLIFHILTAVVGYGAAGVAAAFSLLYCVRSIWSRAAGPLAARLPNAAALDAAAYRCILFAFPFLALLNITGAIWGYDAWGRYWGWDPKETWSLITLFVYIFYLHARLRAGWRGVKVNAVVLVAFAAVMFTFIGVNRLAAFSQSLHSYASPG